MHAIHDNNKAKIFPENWKRNDTIYLFGTYRETSMYHTFIRYFFGSATI